MPDMAILRLDIQEWWHASAGRGIRSDTNAMALRDGMLPYLPGRTVKGLLRDAMALAEEFSKEHADRGAPPQVPPGATSALFGVATDVRTPDRATLAEQRYATERGRLHVGSARLPEAWQRWAATPQGQAVLADMAEDLHRTAIDDDGQVDSHTLRSIEVMPPITLHAKLTLLDAHDLRPEHQDWRALLNVALPLLRGLGAGRTRGLGRVSATLHDAPEGDA